MSGGDRPKLRPRRAKKEASGHSLVDHVTSSGDHVSPVGHVTSSGDHVSPVGHQATSIGDRLTPIGGQVALDSGPVTSAGGQVVAGSGHVISGGSHVTQTSDKVASDDSHVRLKVSPATPVQEEEDEEEEEEDEEEATHYEVCWRGPEEICAGGRPEGWRETRVLIFAEVSEVVSAYDALVSCG